MKFKVIALSVGGLGKKIFSSGDIVTAENFPSGHAEKLVEQGFLEPVVEGETSKEAAKTTEETANAEKLVEQGKQAEEKDKKPKKKN